MRGIILVVMLSALCSAQSSNREDACVPSWEGACVTDEVEMLQTKFNLSHNNEQKDQAAGRAEDDEGLAEHVEIDQEIDQAEEGNDEEASGKTGGSICNGRRRGLTSKIPDAKVWYRLYNTKAEAQKAQNAIPPFKKWVTKMGLTPGNGGTVTKEILAMFAPGSKHLHNNAGAKWLYNYQIVPSDTQISFLNQYNVEFVPMLGFRKVFLLSNKWTPNGYPPCEGFSCKGYALARSDLVPKQFYSVEPTAKDEWRQMTPKQMVDLTRKVINKLNKKPKFFMGMNEPEDCHLQHKNYSPEEAEYMWAKFAQTIGTSLSLTLVSPTVNTPGWGGWTGDWFASFLLQCYKSRNRKVYPCNIEKIGRISVHYYTCMASRWEAEYAFPGGAFYQNVATELGSHIHSKKWWIEFLRKRPLWVTEFNCNNDNIWGGDYWKTLSSHRQQCERITGKAPPGKKEGDYTIWGEGVVRWLENAPNVERWSWWSTYGGKAPGIAAERQAAASLVNPTAKGVKSNIKAGDGTPVEIKEKARAILMGTNIGGSCDFSHCPLSPCLNKQPWKETCKFKSCKGCPQCQR